MNRTIPSQRLHQLLVFEAIVRHGSMTAAAQSLGVSKSVVSGHLRKLETELGVRLLERTTRSMSLTQVGEEVLLAAQRMSLAALDAAAAAESERSEIRGELRVAFTLALWPGLIRPVLQRLRRAHPGLRVVCFGNDARVDLVEERLDIAVRIGVPTDSSNVITRLAKDREILAAAPELAAQWVGKPPAALAQAHFVGHRYVPRRTLEMRNGERSASVAIPPPVVVVDTAQMLLEVASDGLGLCVAPSHMLRADLQSGRLVRVLQGWSMRELELYALMPSRRNNRRSAVFLETLREVLGESAS